MKWFRFYNDAVRNAKVRRLNSAQFRFWVELLCLASEQEDRGTIPPPEDVALIMRQRPSKVRSYMETLISVGLVDRDGDGTFRPHNWRKRQPPYDDAAGRMRRSRAEVDRKCSEHFPNGVPDGVPNGVPNMFASRPREPEAEPEAERFAPEPACLPAGAHAHANGEPVTPEQCVELADRLFAGQAGWQAGGLAKGLKKIRDRTGGRWDCVAPALRQVAWEQTRAGAEPVKDLAGLVSRIAQRFVTDGVPVALGWRVQMTPEEEAAAGAAWLERIKAREAERGR